MKEREEKTRIRSEPEQKKHETYHDRTRNGEGGERDSFYCFQRQDISAVLSPSPPLLVFIVVLPPSLLLLLSFFSLCLVCFLIFPPTRAQHEKRKEQREKEAFAVSREAKSVEKGHKIMEKTKKRERRYMQGRPPILATKKRLFRHSHSHPWEKVTYISPPLQKEENKRGYEKKAKERAGS